MTSQINTNRITKNTLFLYVRMIIIMLVSLFTSRVILITLGVEDFGIYNMVGGVVAMFQIISNTLTDATQRYLTFEIGKSENGNINKVFSICIILHIILGIVIVLIAEPIGLWFLHNKLLIPIERLVASEWIFHFSIISMFVMFISVPYNALIIAHERMKAFAAISIFDTTLKLIIAYSLLLSERGDRLIIYGLLLLILQIIIRIIYGRYSIKNFKESRFRWFFDITVAKEMSRFASWLIIGNAAFIGVTHGINLLLGMFFMPIVNAARGISVQVETAVKMFARNFQTAINPQITKLCASGHLSDMNKLVFKGTRFSSFLLLIPTLPIFFETESILNLWLSEVPPYTELFIRLILLTAWTNCFGNTLAVAAKASGDIKRFELYAASIKLIVLPVGYFLLRQGFSPVSVLWVYFICEIFALISNICITHIITGFSIKDFCIEVFIPSFTVAVISSIPLALIKLLIPNASVIRLIVVLMTSVLGTVLCIYCIGITQEERCIINSKIQKLKKW